MRLNSLRRVIYANGVRILVAAPLKQVYKFLNMDKLELKGEKYSYFRRKIGHSLTPLQSSFKFSSARYRTIK